MYPVTEHEQLQEQILTQCFQSMTVPMVLMHYCRLAILYFCIIVLFVLARGLQLYIFVSFCVGYFNFRHDFRMKWTTTFALSDILSEIIYKQLQSVCIWPNSWALSMLQNRNTPNPWHQTKLVHRNLVYSDSWVINFLVLIDF